MTTLVLLRDCGSVYHHGSYNRRLAGTLCVNCKRACHPPTHTRTHPFALLTRNVGSVLQSWKACDSRTFVIVDPYR